MSARERRLMVIDDGEVDDGLARHMIEVLTSFCARLYNRRSARNRTLKAVGCAQCDISPKAVVSAGGQDVGHEGAGQPWRRRAASWGQRRRYPPRRVPQVTAARLDAWEHEPAVWLRKAQAHKRRSARKAAGRPGAHRIVVSCCVCGTVRQLRPSLVLGYTHLVCGPCSKAGRRPDVPGRPGMVLVRSFSVAGFFDGYTYRIAAAEERASIDGAAALTRAAFLNALGEPES